MIKKPMLAVAVEDLNDIQFPVLVTPKLDGIRCLIVDGKAVSRKLKPIPNHYVREYLEANCLEGFDGELIVPGKSFNEIQSLIMSEDGEFDFTYVVFDLYSEGNGYAARMRMLNMYGGKLPDKISLLFPKTIVNIDQLKDEETKVLAEGYEGLMLRSFDSPYKFGRSTLKQGWLLKLKRFKDAEATVIGFNEMMHNNNEAMEDELGHTKRSSHQANLKPAGVLGTLVVRLNDIEFGIGSGFDAAQRKEIWDNKEKYLGKLVTFKYQEAGMLDKPRFPIFKGFRSKDDM